MEFAHFFLTLLLMLVLTGCAFERHYAVVPEKDQVLEVASGDRWIFTLEENATTGYEWDYSCDDDDVEVRIDHIAGESKDGMVGVPGKAKVVIRIHRGYDGPSTVKFVYRRQWEKAKPAKSFVITLFKRTGDEAFWK